MNKKKLFYISAFLFFTAILGLFFTAEFNTNFKVDSEYFLNSVENKEKQLEYYFFKQELAQKLLKDALLMEKEVKNYLASRENSHIDNYDLYWTSFTKEMGLLYSSFTQNSLEKENTTTESEDNTSQWIEITMQFPGKCKECKKDILVGDRELWKKGEGVKHVKCNYE